MAPLTLHSFIEQRIDKTGSVEATSTHQFLSISFFERNMKYL